MAVPTTKATFKSYCLRALGDGVIDINVSDDQTDDRLDEALQYFAQYHYDGIERMYLKYKVTADDVTRMRANINTFTATDKGSVQDNIELEEGTSTTGDTTGDLLLEDGFIKLDNRFITKSRDILSIIGSWIISKKSKNFHLNL